MEIPLRNGMTSQIDDEDVCLFAGYHLTLKRDRKSGIWYVIATKGRSEQISLHRLIMGLEKGDPREVDHANGDGLDNRRLNLRIATRAQNNANRRLRKDNTSGYKGVVANCKRPGLWVAQIMHNSKGYNLGTTFKTKEDAFSAYCEAATRLHGEFARLEKRES